MRVPPSISEHEVASVSQNFYEGHLTESNACLSTAKVDGDVDTSPLISMAAYDIARRSEYHHVFVSRILDTTEQSPPPAIDDLLYLDSSIHTVLASETDEICIYPRALLQLLDVDCITGLGMQVI